MTAICFAVVLALSVGQAAAPAATGSLSGRVVADGSGAPLAGARVMVMPARPNGPFGPPPQATTDEDGRFAFTSLAPGQYRITVQRTGYAPLGQDIGPGQTVTVAAGQAAAGLQLTLQKGAVIAGRVLDPSGAPLPDVRIIALRRLTLPSGAPPSMAGRLVPAPSQGQQTNDIGEFRVSGLAPGEYFIAAARQPGSPFGSAGLPASPTGTAMTTTYYPGTIDQSAAQPIRISGGDTANIEFTMQSAPAFRVSGRVVDESGAGVAGAMVMLVADFRAGGIAGPIGNTQSDAEGRFTIAEVPSGSYHLTASVPFRFGGQAAGSTAGATAGVVASGGSGGFVSFSSAGGGPSRSQTTEITVSGADVTGIRLIVQRPQQ
jgi:protocatechuate 3,4-dioxygenase beta subunit